MLTEQQARQAAQEFLDHLYKDEYTIVLPQEGTHEYRWAWSVLFDTQERIDTGNPMKAPMSRLLYVPQDGAPVAFVPTAFTSEELRSFLETGVTPEHLRPGA